MSGALAAPLEIARHGRIEEHDRFGAERAVLGGAEREHIDAALPGRFGGRTTQVRQGIGEARAIHMHGKPMLPGRLR